MAKVYDIAVLGATACGYAGAIELARRGREVVVVADPGGPAVECPLADWVPADTFADCRALRSVKKAGTEGPFRAIQFHSADLTDQRAHSRRTILGYLLRPEGLLAALKRSAAAVGVKSVSAGKAAGVELAESEVVLAASRQVRARLLLIASGAPRQTLTRLSLPGRNVPEGALTLCGLDLSLSPAQRRKLDKDLHLMALGTNNRLGMFFLAGSRLHVRITFTDEQVTPSAGGTALSRVIADLQTHSLLPAGLNLAKASVALWRPPGGVALDLETHLAKRTLLVGTAGGFASAMSGQTLDATIRSAMVAADVADRALEAPAPQDVLAEYKSLWRDPLADRIRTPGTSIRMLMPMVLSNRTITARFARAFLFGEPI